MVTLCHHSIAHPALLASLVQSGGRFPGKGENPTIDWFWSMVLEDLSQADHVLTNSDFVRETFLREGWPAERVHVLYFGVDQAFLDAIPETAEQRPPARDSEPIKLLFAGSFDVRKGAPILIEALARLEVKNWILEIAGPVDRTILSDHGKFFADPRVHRLGTLPRNKLAQIMARADVFVFPSLAEGSARVVFEALASGCYVVTTANSGSIVQSGVHGHVVEPGNAGKLSAAIAEAAAQRKRVAEIGRLNARLVRRSFSQVEFGRNLDTLYRKLL